jgi:hypothetical protein
MSKTQEQRRRTLERKEDVPKEGDAATLGSRREAGRAARKPVARQSEMPVSRHGMNQESSHNKHNDPGQPGHKPQ